ncbi:Swt1 family HEPN domain-containing protein [Stappia sp. 28M-7]|uniref:Swt1 family HEPN domain-containing protein n=1 Tax=Stappia sp. 28M-7 TaxID=2762596 RepID=UPI00163B72C8|nr:Swt1 family HEPN domain-containing protein [Stappia sp. 28M-7]MBC2857539.1 hypothetical protein [Stappia sp. 28M-7]
MDDGDYSNGDAPPAKTPAVIDLDAFSKTMDAGQGAAEAAGRLLAISERISTAQEVLCPHGGVESLAAQSERAALIIEQTTASLTLPSLMSNSAGLSTYPSTSRIFEDIERQQRQLTSGFPESLARIAMGLPSSSLSTLTENLTLGGTYADLSRTGEMARITTGVSVSAADLHRFEIPDMSAIGALSRSVEALIRPSFDTPASIIQETFVGLHSPWLDTANVLGSAEALVRVQSLGLQLGHQTAFNPDYSALLRETLGDWRDVTAIPDDLEEQVARSEFYVDLGFDTRVIDRPDEAFGETLILAGIAFAPEDNEVEGRHDDLGLARARQLQAAVQKLEAELRSFIVAVLSAEFGPQWVKRLPNSLYDQWIEKQRRDPRGDQLEPIDYADFMDFERIICKRDLFGTVFATYFVSLESARESLMRLVAPRNTAMHSRPIGKDDAVLAAFEIRRLMLRVTRH